MINKTFFVIFTCIAVLGLHASPEPELPGRRFSTGITSTEFSVEIRGVLRVVGSEPFTTPVLVLDSEEMGKVGGASMIALIGEGMNSLLSENQGSEIILSGQLLSPADYKQEWAQNYPVQYPGIRGYLLIGFGETEEPTEGQ